MAKTIHEEEYRLIDKVTAGFQNIAVGLKGLSRSFTELNQAAELAGKGINLVKTAASGIGSAVQGAADYEEAMRRVSIITQATAEEQVQLQEAVRQAAGTVGATADEASAALLTMARDGFSARDAIDNLGTVLAYAKVQATGAADAAQGLGGILDSFGARASLSVGQVADALTATAVAAGTTSDTLEKGLAGIGVAAQESNLSFEQTIALLGQLATRNIEGGDAAKRLATILDQFRDPASQAGKALKELGLNGADFTTVLGRLSTDSAAATKVLEGLGKKPRDALNVLLADGGGALQALTAIINENKGATQIAADALSGTFNDAVDRAAAQLSVLQNIAAGPILTPLADGITLLATRLGEFANSPEFAKLTQQFATFVSTSVEGVSTFISGLNFEAATAKISSFVADSKEAFDALVVVVKATAAAISGVGAAIEYVGQKYAQFDAIMAAAVGGTTRLNVAAREAGKGLEGLGAGLDKNKKSTREHKAATDSAAASIDAFAGATVHAGFVASETAQQLGEIPKAAKLTEISMEKLAGGAAQAAIGLERFRLATLVAAQTTLYNANLSNSASFQALTVEIGKTEASIAAMQAAITGAAQSQDDLAEKTDKATQSLRNQASAADDAAGAADGASESNRGLSESLDAVEQQSKSVGFSIGNMTEAFFKQAQAAAGAAHSADGYIDTWSAYIARYELVNKAAENLLDHLNRQNAALSEEEKIKRRLIAQGFESTTLIDQLVAAELRLANAKKQTNDEAQRGVQIEEQRRGQAGGLGTGSAATQQTAPTASGGRGTSGGAATQQTAPTASGGRGTSGGAGSRDPAPAIVVNVTGAPTDAAGWRDIVSRFIVPELERTQRLSR